MESASSILQFIAAACFAAISSAAAAQNFPSRAITFVVPFPAGGVTDAEAGFPGMELEVWFALFATGGTPQPIVRKLNQEFVKAINSPDVMARFGDQGLDMVSSTPEELTALVKADTARLAPIVKASGARVE